MVSTWIYAAVLAGAGLLLMMATGGVFRSVSASSGSERVLANSPHTLLGFTTTIALFGLFMVAAIFGQAAHQDFGHGTWMLIFTKNVKKAPYLLGRFLGAYLFSATLMLAIIPGLLVGAGVVWLVDKTQLAPHQTMAYVWPYLVGVWPTLFFAGTVFFSLAALTRRMAPVYVGMVVLVLGYLVISSAMSDVANQELGSILDPFGFTTIETVTRYWTPAERNRDLIPFTGWLLINRLLWIAVGAALLGLTVARFRTTVEEHSGARPAAREEAPSAPVAIPTTRAEPTFGSWVRTALSSAWLAFRDVLRSPVYWSFVVAGLAFVSIASLISKQIFGTSTLPVTWQALEVATSTFHPFV
ncbi:ABC transporter permease, partial [Corallococcus terminator]